MIRPQILDIECRQDIIFIGQFQLVSILFDLLNNLGRTIYSCAQLGTPLFYHLKQNPSSWIKYQPLITFICLFFILLRSLPYVESYFLMNQKVVESLAIKTHSPRPIFFMHQHSENHIRMFTLLDKPFVKKIINLCLKLFMILRVHYRG